MSIELTAEELKELEAFTELLYTDEELAAILEVPVARLKAEFKKEHSQVARTITAARFRVESSLRKANIQMALRGSTPAMAQANELLKRLKG